MPRISNAVFLSYASEDAEAAERIATALRAAGVEVWFDKSVLRGGDAWDQSIRKQIKGCALFLPVISHTTHDRREGYFRLEWKLAIDRCHLMDANLAFLLPVVIDDTRDDDERVPERFREVQWTRLPRGEMPPAFVERVQRLLSPEGSTPPHSSASAAIPAAPVAKGRTPTSRSSKRALPVAVGVLIVGAIVYIGFDKLWISKHTFAPPPHSIAVLPFADMSEKKDQEYFSDGLSEEVLNSLAQINDLQVAARTSAFSFKGTNTDIGTIAHKLNVAAVLEGSVRRSEHTMRVTAQLINAVTGFHMWSKTYDRDLGDVLKLQTEIATAVAEALKVTLLGDIAQKIELGGTRNPAAFDEYLRGLKLARLARTTTPMECSEPIAAFTRALALDSGYALAYANRALITWDCATNTPQWLQQPNVQTVRADIEHAISLAPGLPEAYVASSWLDVGLLNLAAADQACARALALSPGNDRVLYHCSLLATYLGRADSAISAARQGVALDPLNPLSHRALGDALRYARRYPEAITAYQASIAVDPEHAAEADALLGISYYLGGSLALAQSSCEAKPEHFRSALCLAMVYERLGRHGDAAAAVAKMVQQGGDSAAYQYSEVNAQWGELKTALEWLEKAMRLGDPGLVYTKTDPLLDPLRKEPRFQAVMRELKFPD